MFSKRRAEGYRQRAGGARSLLLCQRVVRKGFCLSEIKEAQFQAKLHNNKDSGKPEKK